MRHLHTRTPRRRMVTALTVLLFAVPGAPAVADEEGPASPALDNGLALTPPMGFNNWNSTHCGAEFNEAMVKGIADLFVVQGPQGRRLPVRQPRRLLGRCRTATPTATSSPTRPASRNGIKAVADYVHSKGLKFGIYTSAGTKTCDSNGFPGGARPRAAGRAAVRRRGASTTSSTTTATTRASTRRRGTPTMRDALAATGRPDRLQHLRMGPEQAVGLGARTSATRGAPPATSATAGPACCRSLTQNHGARPVRRARATGTTPTCSRSATAA